jgi:hypothetical protein
MFVAWDARVAWYFDECGTETSQFALVQALGDGVE